MTNPAAKRALVTGATGFIGSHLARRLHHLGWQVHVIIRPDSNAESLRQLLSPANVHTHDGSIQTMRTIVERAAPTVAFHLASLFLSRHTLHDVPRLVESNLNFPAQLADALAIHGPGRLINTGTAWQHFENAPYNPVNLYAATKQAYLDILRYYSESATLSVINLELFDTYGPGDTRPKLFAILRKAALSREPLPMSPGEQLLNLVYIDDVIDAYLAAADRVLTTTGPLETFSVRTDNPLRLRDLVELWQKITGHSLNLQWATRPYRPREIMIPPTGPTLPNWRPKVPLEEGIRRMEGRAGA